MNVTFLCKFLFIPFTGGMLFCMRNVSWLFWLKVAFFNISFINCSTKNVYVYLIQVEKAYKKNTLCMYEKVIYDTTILSLTISAFRITSVMQNGWNDGMECQYFLSLSLNKLPSMIYESTPYVTSCYIWISVKCSILAVNWARFIFCLWSLTIPNRFQT